MVSLSDVDASNSRIAKDLPAGLVAVFAGATSGIGEATLKQFAKHARSPRVYFIGRSQEAADRITAECKALNKDGEFIFIKADFSLVRTVDEVCRDLQSKEKAINLIFISMGTLIAGRTTSEGLHFASALVTYCRARLILNLLPQLQAATSLRRVVSCFAATKEGFVDASDFQAWKLPLMQQRGHASSLVTLHLDALAKRAPEVSFVHDFPGPVRSNIARDTKGAAMFAMKAVFKLIGPLVYIPTVESGDRHVFLCTSARYPAGVDGDAGAGVPMVKGVAVARGIDGKSGSGLYSVDAAGESADPKVEELLANFRKEGMVEKVWANLEQEWNRITGEATV